MQLDALFPANVSILCGDPRGDWPIDTVEERFVDGAVLKRKREFRAGRAMARQGISALGRGPTPIAAGPDRAPVWPSGIVGSISHCEDLCVVAVALTLDGFVSIGVDAEPAAALESEIFEEICGREELDWLEFHSPDIRGLYARLIFSAKECAYKCQYPLSGQMLDFHALSVGIDLGSQTFTARFNTGAGPFEPGDRLDGRYLFDADHIVTGLVVTT